MLKTKMQLALSKHIGCSPSQNRETIPLNGWMWQVPLTEEEEELEVKNTIQQTVSHFTSNTNKVLHQPILDLRNQA
jgi:hypothetical protein